jgi:hypothetical protein
MIRHLVLFNFKETASAAEKTAVFRSAEEQLKQIPGVRNLAIGRALTRFAESPYECALSMEFADEAALAVYMDHPLHQQFRAIFRPARAEVPVSLDFADVEGVG